MNTPICDFIDEYVENKTLRLHMPGHKGESFVGLENRDITEIKGADSLFEASGIIRQSEQNASKLFDCNTFYSTEGSSLCIRAMLYLTLLYARKNDKKPLVLAMRNVHKTFLSAVALLDFDVEWMYGEQDTYLSCNISKESLDQKLSLTKEKPVAVYVTSPDYLGNIADVKGLSEVCKKHDVLLLVDNAHGAYLKFLDSSCHPVDLGATMCCDSAHKTLCTLTGGAYLHIAKDADLMFCDNAKSALSLFASTSPSYLILQSLDLTNKYISTDYKEQLSTFARAVCKLKKSLENYGYTLVGQEPLKITIATKAYGYSGYDFAQVLRSYNIECEFCDPDFVVLMLTPLLNINSLDYLKEVLQKVERLQKISTKPPKLNRPQRLVSIREAMLSNGEKVRVKNSVGKVVKSTSLSCPPAVPIVVCGELIDETALECFEYFGISECEIISE